MEESAGCPYSNIFIRYSRILSMEQSVSFPLKASTIFVRSPMLVVLSAVKPKYSMRISFFAEKLHPRRFLEILYLATQESQACLDQTGRNR